MTCEKLEALEKLVQEQLNAGDIEDTTSYLSVYHSSFCCFFLFLFLDRYCFFI